MNNSTSIQDRTKLFGIRIIKASQYLIEQKGVARILANQLLRSGTSIGANSHEAVSAQSTKDFLSKYSIALKEARETEYWLTIIIESGLVNSDRFKPLLNECDQIIRILVATTKKIKDS